MLKDYSLGAKATPPPPEKVAVVYRSMEMTSLNDLSLDTELLTQYKTAIRLLETVQYDEDTPANQKAQVINSITSILSQIVKTQAELFNAERMKTMETTLIEVLKGFPEVQSAFLTAYEKALDV